MILVGGILPSGDNPPFFGLREYPIYSDIEQRSACRSHNPEVIGSNPIVATKLKFTDMSEKKELLPHQQRVVDELAEVKERTSKLGSFILDNPIFLGLPDEEIADLKTQYDAMCVYVDALERRISRF